MTLQDFANDCARALSNLHLIACYAWLVIAAASAVWFVACVVKVLL